jgi:CRISPR type III-B/RAMP module RAMP protein Cmr6
MTATATNEIVQLLGGNRFQKLDSLSLRLQKFTVIDNKSDDKKRQLDLLWQKPHKKIAPPELEIPGGVKFKMKLMGRLIVNQAEGLFENAGLAIHRHYNCPYIPGSALKGIARHAAWYEWTEAEGEQKKEVARKIAFTFGYPTGDSVPKKKENITRPLEEYLDYFLEEYFPEEFGKKDKETEKKGIYSSFAGSVSFLPAFPADDKWELTTDVLTPHGGNDYTNPIPIFFPAVEKGANFKFCVIPVKNRKVPDSFSPVDFAVEYLKKALSEDGAGAKTAAGYGWFDADSYQEEINEADISDDEKKEKAEKSINELAINGYEKKLDTLYEENEFYQRAYLKRFFEIKKKLYRKWQSKNNSNVEKMEKIAGKIGFKIP